MNSSTNSATGTFVAAPLIGFATQSIAAAITTRRLGSDDTFDEQLQSTIGESCIVITRVVSLLKQFAAGVDFKVKMLDARGKRIKMTIWDTGCCLDGLLCHS
jgi:hypothetical protein